MNFNYFITRPLFLNYTGINMTFEEFSAKENKQRNSWVSEDGIQIYLRRSNGYTHDANFELANMSADEPGNGSLKRFLDKYDTDFTFYIENILNERLISFFTNRGYHLVSIYQGCPDFCMISNGCTHISERKIAPLIPGI